ncbi:helix-turn-helix domain-containing protein [Isoptericola sp. NPDC056134]|uniref:helix-turn-helix domain-containing protein n=1 Tax=Isoptericola sp. NPDC056134 TaxID=3345723 RepID=UPI0035E5DCB0
MSTEQHIADEVRAARSRRRKSQAEVAEAVGMHKDTYSKKEQGRSRFDAVELYLIASFLDVHPASFYPGSTAALP